jgi:hypothetical protein
LLLVSVPAHRQLASVEAAAFDYASAAAGLDGLDVSAALGTAANS